MIINPDVEIPNGSLATLATAGLIGEKYIEILPGEGPEICQPGDTIKSFAPVSFDQMGGLLMSVGEDISEVGNALKEMLGGEEPKMNFQHQHP